MITRCIIRVDGTEIPLAKTSDIRQLSALIGADTLDTVNLRDGSVMLVDDMGHSKNLPVNAKATKLYRSICHPGVTHQIRGDAVVTLDEDFA